MKTVKDFDVQGKRVLVRCDFDVPLDDKGIWAKRTSSSSLPSFPSEIKVLDDFRIREALPTIKYLIEKGAKVILMGHAGRPDGKVIEKLRLDPIQNKLMEYLDVSIVKAPDCIGLEIEKWTRQMHPGEILLLENLRFHIEEQENDDSFSKKLSKLGDIYINNAFANSHRDHASMTGVPKYLPAGASLTLLKEIEILGSLIKNPEKPLVVVIGGAKVEETKLKVIDRFSEVAEAFLVGRLVTAEIKNKKLRLNRSEKIVWPVDDMGGGKDIGPQTIKLFQEKILKAKTVFWNGPLGKIEEKEFAKGTEAIARAIINSSAFSVVGGGETVDFINDLGLAEKFNHVSTGGGAMLEFLSGEKLPGLVALK